MTDFEVMDKMAGESMDICMCPDVIDVNKGKKNGKVTFGVPVAVAEKILNSMTRDLTTRDDEVYYVAMYVVNKKQFDKIKKDNP